MKLPTFVWINMSLPIKFTVAMMSASVAQTPWRELSCSFSVESVITLRMTLSLRREWLSSDPVRM